MAWASGIPVLKSMKACGTGNTPITVDDTHQLLGEPDWYRFSSQLKWHGAARAFTDDVPVTVDFEPFMGHCTHNGVGRRSRITGTSSCSQHRRRVVPSARVNMSLISAPQSAIASLSLMEIVEDLVVGVTPDCGVDDFSQHALLPPCHKAYQVSSAQL